MTFSHLKNIGLLRRLKLMLIKRVSIYRASNVFSTPSAYITKYVILNARNGEIFLDKNTRIGNHTEIVPSMGKSIVLHPYATLYSNCKLLGEIEIESYCTIAPNVYISSGTHYATRFPELLVKIQDKIVLSTQKGRDEHSKKVHLHEDVWIGNGVFISAGITIGRGAVIGAGSIITKDIPPYSIVMGVPGRIMKSRLDFTPKESITHKNINDFPYFYRGFNHFKLPEEINSEGFELLKSGLIKILTSENSIQIKGTSKSSGTLLMAIEHFEVKETISVGDFDLTIEIPEVYQHKIVDLNFECSKNEFIYIYSIGN